MDEGGALSASGTLGRPIRFTSIKDDSAGGDTNNDAAASSPNAGDWLCLSVNGRGDFNHCLFTYGGNTASGSWDDTTGAGISFGVKSVGSVENCRIENALYDGIMSRQSGRRR